MTKTPTEEDYARLQAERDRAVEALAEIADLGPATCEITLATTMAQLAAEAISTLPPPVKEAEPEPVAWIPSHLLALLRRNRDHMRALVRAGRDANHDTPLYTTPPALQARVEALDEPTRWLLKIVAAAGGKIDAGDYPWSPLNAFCDDRGTGTDTFNLANEAGYLRTGHDSDSDGSTAYLTDKGRAALTGEKG